MKTRKLLCWLLIVASLAACFGYRAVTALATDNDAPEISISSETLELSVQDPRSTLLQGVTAADKRDGDVTSSLIIESVTLTDSSGTITVAYAAFDRAGNVAKAERTARYTDYVSPRFSLSAPLAFAQSSNFDILDIISVEDTLDGDISHRIRATSLDNSTITSLGNHQVEFRVTNSLGETVTMVLPVEVYLSGSYQAKLSLTDYLVYLPVGASFNAQSYLDTYTYGQDSTNLKNGLPKNFSLRTTGEVDTATPGVYDVAYRVTYTRVNENSSAQNQSYVGYSKLIVVVEG